ncbi:hypothetical protein [Moorena sp. SIO3I8]|uniref:hypothetical protein n=1 Tax=Moorena sp. SIO3I8 TaxID=2607833 RepID=UPI0013BEBD98|nr:hypothetical protein [Moorena sp. SIO3I8]NEO10344.1 hypothetical protein [Moorena sp. SIO3I8]
MTGKCPLPRCAFRRRIKFATGRTAPDSRLPTPDSRLPIPDSPPETWNHSYKSVPIIALKSLNPIMFIYWQKTPPTL